MLSFMREQEVGDSAVQKPDAAPDRIPNDAPEQEYLTVAAKGKNVRRTTYLLAVLFAIGMLCLLFMIKKSTPQTATAAVVGTAEAQIEKAITRLTGIRSEMFNRMDEIVRKFYEFSDVQQVRVNELVKNPFERDVFGGNLKANSPPEAKDPDTDADMMLQQRLMRQAKDLRLLSIMQSVQGNCCMIDDKILYEGDSINGFKVRQISDSFVRLECKIQSQKVQGDPKSDKERLGTQIILKLSE